MSLAQFSTKLPQHIPENGFVLISGGRSLEVGSPIFTPPLPSSCSPRCLAIFYIRLDSIGLALRIAGSPEKKLEGALGFPVSVGHHSFRGFKRYIEIQSEEPPTADSKKAARHSN
ncbi:hypothetical protein Agabi119p4_3875 [Agaricus bisporus var. burnettii]|uniref:Uncharacterized protein n=1 Tax=Agaricus bisporus var. burnettii TaxID=192524 RepID=A0A8H7KID7_AGABI|nr:hypothetical protein Agabi119p4_3875 [Agaricus bisporus var. burnettii]